MATQTNQAADVLLWHGHVLTMDHASSTQQAVAIRDIALPDGTPPIDLLALDEALTAFGERDPRSARIVELRFFAGLTEREIATVLGVSPFPPGALGCFILDASARM